MTVNGITADDSMRQAAIGLWRKVLEDPTIKRHVTVEYNRQEIRLAFDSKEEQLAFLRELAGA